MTLFHRSFCFIVLVYISTACLNASPPEARPTFHCIGLYWSPDDGAVDNPCKVFYRKAGIPTWQQAMNLWFDDQPHSGASSHTNEYRGSIVNLYPGTHYEIKLSLQSGTEEVFNTKTWDENFKIKKVITLPAGESNEAMEFEEGGSEEEGYVLYAPPEGEETIIDVQDLEPHCVSIKKSWMILRGLTLRGAKQHGILLGNVQDVVIEECDISGWGRVGADGWGENFDSAIYSNSSRLERIIIQRNKIHNPRSDANSWEEDGHPEGPQGITFVNGRGHYVVRYNEIWGDQDHYYNDSMGEYHNFSYAGFPNRDSDIYCNKISHCWDDAIEAEGANMNVRIWSNLLDSTYMALGLATTSLGPSYVFRNVSFFSQRAPKPVNKYTRNGALIKLGNENSEYTRGKMNIFHNTIAQPPSPWGQANIKTNGCESGLLCTGEAKHQTNITGRNNILHVNNYAGDKSSINMADAVPSNDFDYDIYNGKIPDIPGIEAHGIKMNVQEGPTFDPLNSDFAFFLAPATNGHDAGEIIANFNDGFEGKAPDIGAYEIGRPALVWGVDADWSDWLQQAGLSVERIRKKYPNDFSLAIYPNPFNHATTFYFRLDKTENIKITIYNIAGRKVDFVSLGRKPSGAHQYVWDANQHGSGAYFIRIDADSGAEIRKCILLK
ncbi:T9SS C-terminal target domain-containing protein [candidate division KSB1 bacterium]|nr:T9SS type A sorting domain-containing protein [candidate division KSB1 bacterium]RQW03754.1 MAG: T9SS C-terminal target domain-containing protein [candidate division KSB1 bacterium]